MYGHFRKKYVLLACSIQYTAERMKQGRPIHIIHIVHTSAMQRGSYTPAALLL